MSPGVIIRPTGFVPIETVNPLVEKITGINEIKFMDIFKNQEQKVHLIKCANILNRGYFSGDSIVAAVYNMAAILVEGGYILISQNNQSYSDGEAFLFCKKIVNTLKLSKHQIIIGPNSYSRS